MCWQSTWHPSLNLLQPRWKQHRGEARRLAHFWKSFLSTSVLPTQALNNQQIDAFGPFGWLAASITPANYRVDMMGHSVYDLFLLRAPLYRLCIGRRFTVRGAEQRVLASSRFFSLTWWFWVVFSFWQAYWIREPVMVIYDCHLISTETIET